MSRTAWRNPKHSSNDSLRRKLLAFRLWSKRVARKLSAEQLSTPSLESDITMSKTSLQTPQKSHLGSKVAISEIIEIPHLTPEISPYLPYSQPSTILNFRDVSSLVNDYLKSEWVAPGRFYRSARPDEASLADRAILQERFGIRTIVDLRTTTEHKQQAEKRETRIRNADLAQISSSITGEEITRPLRIPGISYADINFNGSAYSRFMLAQLDWYSFLKVIFLMALGRRLEAISVLASTVMRPRGLAGLAIDSLEVCRAEVKAVFEVLADETRYPVLVHCTQGKDRTGLIVQLALMLLTTPQPAIQVDYMRTTAELMAEREEKLLEIHSIGLTDEFADCDPHLVGIVESHILEKYGGIEEYLEHCGVTAKMRDAIRKILAGKEQLIHRA